MLTNLNKLTESLLLFLVFYTVPITAQLLPEKVTTNTPGFVSPVPLQLGKPEYPRAARFVKASGAVEVSIVVNEKGEVESAQAKTGHPLLRAAAVNAALESKFKPATLLGKPVRFRGVIIFNFDKREQVNWESVGKNLMSWLNQVAAVSANPALEEKFAWEGFIEEQKEYNSLIKDESLEGKQTRAGKLINLIRYKLSQQNSVADLWKFNFGIATGGVGAGIRESKKGTTSEEYVKEMVKLVDSAPAEISALRIEDLKAILSTVKDKELTPTETYAFLTALTENRNKFN